MNMDKILKKIYNIEFGFVGASDSPIFICVKNKINKNTNNINNLIISKNYFDMIKKEATSKRYLNLTGMGYLLSDGFGSSLLETKDRIFGKKEAEDFKRQFALESAINYLSHH